MGKAFRLCRSYLTYARYNAELSREGLDALGLKHIDPVHAQQMDSVVYIGETQEVGRAVAEQKVKAERRRIPGAELACLLRKQQACQRRLHSAPGYIESPERT